jgi:hypothetical protein
MFRTERSKGRCGPWYQRLLNSPITRGELTMITRISSIPFSLAVAGAILAAGNAVAQQDAFSAIYTNAYNRCMSAAISSQAECERAAVDYAKSLLPSAPPQSSVAPPAPDANEGAAAVDATQRARRLCVGSAMMAGADAMRALAACSGAGSALPRTSTCQNIGGIVTCSRN